MTRKDMLIFTTCIEDIINERNYHIEASDGNRPSFNSSMVIMDRSKFEDHLKRNNFKAYTNGFEFNIPGRNQNG